MSKDKVASGSAEECRALAAAWPRPLIADGSAPGLAEWWVASRREAIARGLSPNARHPLTRPLSDGLFEARRARRLERGLEGAETLLAAEDAGLSKTAAVRPETGSNRISRLLIVSADGSERFYRQVEKLRQRFEHRLEVLLLECDESALGGAAFGPGRNARAVLIHHKDAVVRLLSVLETVLSGPDV